MHAYAPEEVRLLLDENISPNITSKLWDAQVDSVPLRDRAMLRMGDHQVLRYAQKEGRAVVTIDEHDYAKQVAKLAAHPGIVVIPSGGSRDEQYGWIIAAVEYARKHPEAMEALKDRITSVSEDYEIASRHACATPLADTATITVLPVSKARVH